MIDFLTPFSLQQLPDFCSKDNSLIVKEIFGVTEYVNFILMLLQCSFYLTISTKHFSEDAEKLRIHALAEAGDIEALEKMVEFEKTAESSSDKEEDSNEEDDSNTTS